MCVAIAECWLTRDSSSDQNEIQVDTENNKPMKMIETEKNDRRFLLLFSSLVRLYILTSPPIDRFCHFYKRFYQLNCSFCTHLDAAISNVNLLGCVVVSIANTVCYAISKEFT